MQGLKSLGIKNVKSRNAYVAQLQGRLMGPKLYFSLNLLGPITTYNKGRYHIILFYSSREQLGAYSDI